VSIALSRPIDHQKNNYYATKNRWP